MGECRHKKTIFLGLSESPICLPGQNFANPARRTSNPQSQSQTLSKSSNRMQNNPEVMLKKQLHFRWQERADGKKIIKRRSTISERFTHQTLPQVKVDFIKLVSKHKGLKLKNDKSTGFNKIIAKNSVKTARNR